MRRLAAGIAWCVADVLAGLLDRIVIGKEPPEGSWVEQDPTVRELIEDGFIVGARTHPLNVRRKGIRP